MKSFLVFLMMLSAMQKNNRIMPPAISGGAWVTSSHTNEVQQDINQLYSSIDFGGDSLNREAFNQAVTGYLQLLCSNTALGSDTAKQVISICDMSLSSNKKRLWVIDLYHKKVLFHTLVAHGQGTGEEYAARFSNENNSHQTSLGFYITAHTYTGSHGLSLKLKGVDKGFNDNAEERNIVVHGAPYVSERFISENQRLGRSWGCPAVPQEYADAIIHTIADGTCMYIYYPDRNYTASSPYLHPAAGLAQHQAVAHLLAAR